MLSKPARKAKKLLRSRGVTSEGVDLSLGLLATKPQWLSWDLRLNHSRPKDVCVTLFAEDVYNEALELGDYQPPGVNLPLSHFIELRRGRLVCVRPHDARLYECVTLPEDALKLVKALQLDVLAVFARESGAFGDGL